MNNSSVSYLRKPLALLIGAGLSLIAVNAAFAQQPPASADQTVKLEKFVVTGSYIPAAADEAKALPVQVIDAQAIALSGVSTNILDVLRKTVPQIQGGNNIGTENANISGASTNGGSQVSLRNTDTLVLINGKRVAPQAVAASGEAGTGGEFVDLNMVPISAVERIEVLTDGASAIYGTDAVSGVINIILKKDYRGAEFDFHYTQAANDTGGYWRSRAASMVVGAGDDKTNLMISAEWTKSDPIWQRDLAYESPFFATPSYPGVINDPSGNFYNLKSGLNTPPASTAAPVSAASLIANGTYILAPDITVGFDLAHKPTVLNAVEKRIVTVNANHKITDTITLKADFLYATTEANYQLNPQPVSQSSTTLIANGQSYITDTGWTIRNRFIAGPNRIYDNKTDFYRGTFELEGKVNDYFNWDVYANYNLSTQVALGENLILNSALVNAIKSGAIDLFAITQDQTKLAAANIYGTSIQNLRSELYTYNAIANGKIYDLPAGPIQYAAGLEYRKEGLDATADYNSTIPPGGTTGLWNNGTSLAPFNGSRNIKSEYAELKVPIFSPQQNIPGLHLLTFDGAVRHEAYSDGNKTTVPKFSLRYLPINDELAFRATYAKSFAAPTLYDLHGPSTSGFTNSPGSLLAYNSSGTATGGHFPNIQAFQLNGFNPALTPAKAKSYTAGVIYSPKAVKGLEISVDYFNIKQTDLIGAPGSANTIMQSVEQLGSASPFSPFLGLGNFPGQGGTHVTGPGQVSTNLTNVYVLESLVNIATETQHGFDVNLKYTFPWKEYGLFAFNSEWAILQSFFVKTGPTDPGTEAVGTDWYSGTLPKVRSYNTLDWTYQGYGATLAYTHLNSTDDGSGNKIGPYNTFDLQLRYELSQLSPYLKGVSFDIGCNNFTNQKPPLDPNNYSSPKFDASAFSYFGRMYYMDLKIKF